MSVANQDPAFADRVAERLAVIEQALHKAAVASTPFVTEAATHIIRAGGKRFRPLLVTMSAELDQLVDVDRLTRAALVVELTHVGSLYHDDVMDEADLRRGTPSANRRWDNSVAILVGDYLFSQASLIVATLGTEFVTLQAQTFSRLVQGQIAETRGPLPGEDPLEHYLKVVADKTGSLIATSAVFGGMVAQASQEVLAALDRFGEEIGVVFQLSDDVIDLTSDVAGKTPGTDLREGVLTLPTLLALRSTDPADARLKELISREIPDSDDLAEALRLMRVHPGLTQAREEITRRSELARSYLAPLPEGAAKQALAALCDTVVSRAS